jgi:hypothetical protein
VISPPASPSPAKNPTTSRADHPVHVAASRSSPSGTDTAGATRQARPAATTRMSRAPHHAQSNVSQQRTTPAAAGGLVRRASTNHHVHRR